MASSRPPFIVWRYLTSELLRTLVLFAGGLVVLVSFAAAIRPLAKGDVGLGDAIRLMGLLSVPMSQFALPFAAGFAATVVYHRFSSDNEATACRASGIPQRAILMPSLFVGLILALVVAVLANSVMPRFYRAAEQIIARDIGRLIVNPINDGNPIRLGAWDLYADEVYRPELPEDSTALDHLILLSVVASQIGEDGATTQFVSARRVDMWLSEATPEETGTGEWGTSVQLAFTEPVGLAPEGDVSFSIGTLGTGRIILPSSFEDDPKLLTFRELREARREPRRLDITDRRARELALELGRVRVAESVRDRVENDRRLVLTRGDETIAIEADTLTPIDGRWRLASNRQDLNEPLIRVVYTNDRGFSRTHFAQGATLRFASRSGSEGAFAVSVGAGSRAGTLDGVRVAGDSAGESGERIALTLELEQVITLDSAMAGADADAARDAANTGAEQQLLAYSGVVLAGQSDLPEADWPAARLLEAADDMLESDGSIAQAQQAAVTREAKLLRERIDRQDRDIVSRMHERAAFVCAVLLMGVLSAIIAMRLRDALPLVVFLWSFFPALGAVVLISSGQQTVEKSGLHGLLILWGGVVLLAGVAAHQYRALVRV
jgi:lipopolysaccharide export LptBFGC system permease protein LptF